MLRGGGGGGLVAAAVLLLPVGPGRAAAGDRDRTGDCDEACSDSNSSLAPGDRRFAVAPSGLRYLDVKSGTGAQPRPGQAVVVSWTGYTEGYQAKRIESSQDYDEPFRFELGRGQAIPAFEEAVSGMKVGGVRRIEIPGRLVSELAYPISPKAARYERGPKPRTFAGLRTLDFVLDNDTLQDFNRTLLFDVRLDNVR